MEVCGVFRWLRGKKSFWGLMEIVRGLGENRRRGGIVGGLKRKFDSSNESLAVELRLREHEKLAELS
jgi:hypothetical protein